MDREWPETPRMGSEHHRGQILQRSGQRAQLFTAFAIKYSYDDSAVNSSLCQHQDDSDLTLNLSLLSEQEGCKVCFEGGQYVTSGGSVASGVYTPSFTEIDLPPGYCLFHRGRHPHQVMSIERGERWSLILLYKRAKAE